MPTFDNVEDAIDAGNTARDLKPPNYNEAERAYQVAAKIAPDDERGYIGLGNVYLDQRRDQDAAVPYRKALELKTRNPQVSEALGDIYFRLSKYSESIEASSESVRLKPERPGPYWTLAWVSLTIGKTEDAGFFANAFINRWKPHFEGDSPYYILFAGYLGYRSAGLNEKANELLAAPGVSSACNDTKWHCRVLKYLRHELTAQQLMAEADDQDKMTEARGYIGLDLAFSGHRAEALPHLHWVVEKGNRAFVEYHLAKEWIARLEKR